LDSHSTDILANHKTDDEQHRTKIDIGLTFLTSIVAFDKNAQPSGDSPCSRANGGCSHLCVPSDDGVDCLCPSSLLIDSDMKTCVADPDGRAKQNRVGPNFVTRTTTEPLPLWWPTHCVEDYCLNGGRCIDELPFIRCSCVKGTDGLRCENASGLLAESSGSSAAAWIAGVLASLATVAVVLGILYFSHRQGYLNSPRVVRLRSALFGLRADEDEHKTSLVSPTYENPGYVDIDDDETVERKPAGGSSGPNVTPFVSRKECSYIKRLDTADP